jgi:tyrosine-specific transport protein
MILVLSVLLTPLVSLFEHSQVMVAFIAQGGANLNGLLDVAGRESLAAVPGAGQVAFAAVCGVSLYAAKPSVVEKLNIGLVLGVVASFLGVMAIGAQTADFGALVDLSNQHPEQVANCFPIIFVSLVYQNVVPTVVNQLEGDRTKITQAIIAGTTIPLLMFLAWNAVALGNVMGMDLSSQFDPVAVLQSGATGNALLGPLVSSFSSLALLTSVIGFTYGLEDAWTGVLNISPETDQYQKWKAPIFGLMFLPPLALSVADPDIFIKALEYGGAFGVSTLFLVLPPLMVWRERYSEDEKLLLTKPMVPFGKIALGSMWKAAGTLILEQGADKLGVFDFFREQFLE